MNITDAIRQATTTGASNKIKLGSQVYLINEGDLYEVDSGGDADVDVAILSTSLLLSPDWTVVPVARRREITELQFEQAWNSARGTSSVKPAGQSEFYNRLFSTLFGR